MAKGADVMCIETNLRASRSFPFVSKTMGVDFIEAATKAMVDHETDSMNLPNIDDEPDLGYVGVKAPMFSFTRLRGADPVLGVEMASTGEVACFGANKEEAFLKSLLSTGFKMPEKNILVSVQDSLADDFCHSAYQLHDLGYVLHATPKTAIVLEKNGIPCVTLNYPTDKTEPNVSTYLKEGKIDMTINIPTHESDRLEDNYEMRRTTVDFGVPLLTNLQLVKVFADAAKMKKRGELLGLSPKSLFEHYQEEKASEAWTGESEFH